MNKELQTSIPTDRMYTEELYNLQTRFFQLPKFLFENPYYNKISNDAKVMYSILKDRQNLSIQNNWKDENGKIFFNYSNEELKDILGLSEPKIISCKKELVKVGLLFTKTMGRGYSSRLYVLRPKYLNRKVNYKSFKEYKKFNHFQQLKNTIQKNEEKNIKNNVKNDVENKIENKSAIFRTKENGVSNLKNFKARNKETKHQELKNLEFQTLKNLSSKPKKFLVLELKNFKPNNTNNNKTKYNNTNNNKTKYNNTNNNKTKYNNTNNNKTKYNNTNNLSISQSNNINNIKNKQNYEKNKNIENNLKNKNYKNYENNKNNDDRKTDGEKVKIKYQNYKNILEQNLNREQIAKTKDKFVLLELDNVIGVMLDVILFGNEKIKIGDMNLPKELVINRFLKLEYDHIDFVMRMIRQNTKPIRNYKNYLLTCLYNSYSMFDIHIQNEINKEEKYEYCIT